MYQEKLKLITRQMQPTVNPRRQNLECSAPQQAWLCFDIQCRAGSASTDLQRYADSNNKICKFVKQILIK